MLETVFQTFLNSHFFLLAEIQNLLPEISGAPILGVSAKSGYNVEKTLDLAIETYKQWQTYIKTNKLVDWLNIELVLEFFVHLGVLSLHRDQALTNADLTPWGFSLQ